MEVARRTVHPDDELVAQCLLSLAHAFFGISALEAPDLNIVELSKVDIFPRFDQIVNKVRKDAEALFIFFEKMRGQSVVRTHGSHHRALNRAGKASFQRLVFRVFLNLRSYDTVFTGYRNDLVNKACLILDRSGFAKDTVQSFDQLLQVDRKLSGPI